MKSQELPCYMNDHFNCTIYRTRTIPANHSRTGYGAKLPTQYVAVDRDTRRRYRVYAICYSNAATLYIVSKGQRYIVRNFDIPEQVEVLA